MSLFFRWLVVLAVSLSAAAAQNPSAPQLQPRPPEPPAQPSTGADRQITVDVQVRDKSGAPVRGLQKQDFTVLDDKQPKNILSFQSVDSGAGTAADPPVETVLVVDAVNTGFQAVTFERAELKKFLLQNDGKLAVPTSLVIFTDTGTKMQNGSSRDGKALAALYDQYETGLRSIGRSQGFYGATERFDLSLKTLAQLVAYEGKRPGRKLIIWFSPGWPLLSGPRIELTNKDEQHFFDSIVTTSGAMRQARITLYAIDPLGMEDAGGSRTFYYKEFVKGVSSYKRAQPGDLALQVLAVQSGGLVLNSTNDLVASIADCASDANAFYVLTLDSARADHADEYHALGVTVDKPGVTARTRTGYYAQP
jgi:VWFA-related protein